MLTLEELTDHRDAINNLNNRARVTDDESQALEIVNQMLSALIYQLENQSMSFTP
jgi:ABC-type transporter Mla subunit MlaD